MDWDHGYYANSTYTCGFYRETAPNWLDFAALVKGHPSPRRKEGDHFRYLDLGCGTGFGLCLLAALYPEGEFVGVDFHPEHIAHASWLSRELALDNILFLEADFLDLKQDPTPLQSAFRHNDPDNSQPKTKQLGEGYHYVSAHGIATWVAEPVQEAMLAVAASALAVHGIFYCSYNTYPGWLHMQPFQQLVQLEASRGDPSEPTTAFQRAVASFRGLLGEPNAPLPLGQMFPSLQQEIGKIADDDLSYLYGEYLTENWMPLPVSQMHQRCQRHKLTAIATANLPELFEELLPAPLRAVVLPETNPLLRQTLIDLGTVKGFRRDLLVRGDLRISQLQWQQQIGAVRVRLQEAPPLADYRFETSFGDVQGQPEAYAALEAALAAGPLTLAELVQRTGQQLQPLLIMVAMLLEAGRIGLDRGGAAERAEHGCHRVNRAVIQQMQLGWRYAHLAAPRVGNGIECNPMEATLLEGLQQGLSAEALASQAGAVADRLGVVLGNLDRQPIVEPAQRRQALSEMANLLSQQRLPFLQPLGLMTGSADAE